MAACPVQRAEDRDRSRGSRWSPATACPPWAPNFPSGLRHHSVAPFELSARRTLNCPPNYRHLNRRRWPWRRGSCRATGGDCTATGPCCWKPTSIRSGTQAPPTRRPAGSASARRRGAGRWAACRPRRPSKCGCARCTRTGGRSCCTALALSRHFENCWV